tara:strand:+ start:17595 stop:18317 length:723 start_codon:yes stop_codon:yes gene_type:complete
MLIGIQSSTGARSGKDTVAAMLLEGLQSNHIIESYAFASPIKQSINELFGWDERHEDGALKEIVLPTFLPSKDQWTEVVGNFYRKHENLNTILQCYNTGCQINAVFEAWAFDNKRVVKSMNLDGYTQGGLLLHVSPREVYQLFGTEMMRECVADSFWTDIAPTENVIITDVRFKNETEWLFANNGVLIDVKRPDNQVSVAAHASEAGTGVGADYEIVNDGTLEQLEQEVMELVERLERHE